MLETGCRRMSMNELQQESKVSHQLNPVIVSRGDPSTNYAVIELLESTWKDCFNILLMATILLTF